MSSKLFSPFRIGGLELTNCIIVAPVCQYSALNGTMIDWHMMHVGSLVVSGASLFIIEATGVTPEGRISPTCTGLYSDENQDHRQRFHRTRNHSRRSRYLSRALQAASCDYVTVSGGGMVLDAKVSAAPGYQVPFAEKIKRDVGIVTGAVGLISDPQQAENILSDGKADFIALARAMLFNPRWAWHAAVALGENIKYPCQYARSPESMGAGSGTGPSRLM